MVYSIKQSSAFKRALKSYQHDKKLLKELAFVVDELAQWKTLSTKYRNHKLQWDNAWLTECHIRPDVLLIYYYEQSVLVLVLVDIGSHSDLF